MSDTKAVPVMAEPETDDRARQRTPLQRLMGARATWIFLLDIALIALFTALSREGVFLSWLNTKALLLSGAEALLLAVGLAMLLGAGKFDLSLGANLVMSSVMAALAMVAMVGAGAGVGVTILAGLVVCLGTGAMIGALNGMLVAVFGINSLIATLGMLGVITGFALVATGNGQDVTGFPHQLQSGFGLRTIGGIPAPALLALTVALAMWVVIRFTAFGRHTLAIGSAPLAAERVGLRVTRHVMSLFVLAGMLAGLAGFIDIAHYQTTVINGHNNAALQAVAAAVIGGTALEGGRISIMGTIWGVALAVILQNGLVIIGVSSAYQLMAVGAVLIVAVGLDRMSSRRP
ncbi:Ribose/xylose/arabinose/galactoside ABC-type transport system, permease component [Rubellimicrobium thermophilum DSM 16684]|uniref:Ribose/xylose/arabinose/galactoside ABC-type transport system, permease component n=1 Tax=Rubellimicrobium thermophilum DSM 16684 TaxID=1123069 RepID=S9R181_9RHOB|nr:ABC transporter permease [Rubellimicrobium thermophilum]EPX87436.1 Ribose/xylose/arabinose/galactoside ABC-type transport system, permease component [Rubellimicrobium thermophilum DSM 16684]